MDQDQLIGAVEALIFVSGDPLPAKRLTEVLDAQEEEIRSAIQALSERYLQIGSALQVMEVAGGFQLRTCPVHSVHVNRFLEKKRKSTLSSAAMETIAIVAYKQPITRAEMEAIRGVGVDGVLKSLLDKRLIKVVGSKDVPGRPNLYGTTRHFLEYFSINSLKDLPPIEDLSETFSSVSVIEDGGDIAGESSEEQPNEGEKQNETQSSDQANG
ncbi:MAG: SMC-Scp complex subunit ScpB [Candidatus Omnitrophota bacterium]|jgi:segregation and condensation protein B|nr:MAG: SMC-Scp complex subunit ScpB [Candidatus Omnitrophota bacterium]